MPDSRSKATPRVARVCSSSLSEARSAVATLIISPDEHLTGAQGAVHDVRDASETAFAAVALSYRLTARTFSSSAIDV